MLVNPHPDHTHLSPQMAGQDYGTFLAGGMLLETQTLTQRILAALTLFHGLDIVRSGFAKLPAPYTGECGGLHWELGRPFLQERLPGKRTVWDPRWMHQPVAI